MPSWSGVSAFVHVAEQRSFREAARILGVTPTAVSKAVTRLEERLGVVLVQRTSRSVALTPEGALYLEGCRDALDRLRGAEDRLTRQADDVRGAITVSLPRILGSRIVRVLSTLRDRHPELSVRLVVTDRDARLAEEEVDVALRIGDLPDSSLIARRLFTPAWVTVAAPRYVQRRGLPSHPGELDRHACLRFARPAGGVADLRFVGPDGPAVVRGDSALVVDDGDLLLEACCAGLGVAQVFDFMVVDLVARGVLVEVLREWRAPGPPVRALSLPGRGGIPRVRAFLDATVEVLGVGAAAG